MNEIFVDVAGNRFRVLERPGEGTPLLFLHGLGDTADQLEPIASRLPGDRRLLAFDQRGHGGSCKPDDGYSPVDFAEDARALLEALGVTSAHLFGHSMGGRNALLLAALHPSIARSLILGDIGPDENRGDIEATRAFFEGLPDRFADEDEARIHLRRRKPGYTDETIDLLMRNLERADDGTLRWRYSRAACIAAVTAARSRDWYEYLPRVACPMLLLHVGGSSELSDEVAERMQREAPAMHYHRLDGTGHNFHLEAHVPAAALIALFIRRVERDAPTG